MSYLDHLILDDRLPTLNSPIYLRGVLGQSWILLWILDLLLLHFSYSLYFYILHTGITDLSQWCVPLPPTVLFPMLNVPSKLKEFA